MLAPLSHVWSEYCNSAITIENINTSFLGERSDTLRYARLMSSQFRLSGCDVVHPTQRAELFVNILHHVVA